jgi:predicted Zn finger-like uncharacterized protein
MAQSLTLEDIKPKLKLVKAKTPPKETPKTTSYQSTRVTALEDGLNLNRKDGGLVKYSDISMLIAFQLDTDPGNWYIETFVYGQPTPFRLSQKAINYRQFLSEVSQRSKDNFYTFLLFLIEQSNSVYVDEVTLEFLKSEKMVGYPDFKLFEDYTRQLWFQLMSWMKFQCDKCSEVYWVDDAKISDQGAKTKCVKCQNLITVKKRSRPTPLTSKEKRKTVPCPHCQYENPEGAQFCTMCQKPLVSFAPKPKVQEQKPSEAEQKPVTDQKLVTEQKKAEKVKQPSPAPPAAPALDLSGIPRQAHDTMQFSRSLHEIAASLQDDINTLENKFAWFTKFSLIMQILGFLFFAGGILSGVYILFVLPAPLPPEVLTWGERMTYAGISVGVGFLFSLGCIIVSNIIALTLEIERNTKVTALLMQRLISKQE